MAIAALAPSFMKDWLGGLARGLAARPAGRPWTAYYERILGTSLELQIRSADEAAARRAEHQALEEIRRLEAVFSNYSEQSELRRWQQTIGVPHRLSAELLEVLQAGERWREVTGDAFHPGTEALTREWQQAAALGVEPSDLELRRITAALAEPLWRVEPAGVTATRLQEVPINLNAIAKGFIVDRACERVVQQPGVQQVLLNLGGDLRVIGPNALIVGIADPACDAENAPPVARIRVRNGAVATSGGYRRGVQVGDRWHSHLVDARTGRPVEHVSSASVAAGTAMDADVLATAFSVLQPEESLALADSLPGVACFLVGKEGQSWSNARWSELLVK